MASTFRLYPDGSVQFADERITAPLSFAHVTDLHLPPDPPELWPDRYKAAIEWWHIALNRPNERLPRLLDEIRDAEVDFVFFGGDIIDYYHPETAERVVRLCRERGLKTHFQLGNHDWENDYLRYVTHEYDDGVRADSLGKLCAHWNMPGSYYAFEHGGVRFISLDAPYYKREHDYAGVFDTAQTDWFEEQVRYDGPIVIFQHVPFNLPTFGHRVKIALGGLACIAEDDNGKRVLAAIEGCENLLGLFTGHVHFRSEDAIGSSCQFSAAPGHTGQWRLVKIANSAPPKSLYVDGAPVAD